MKKIKNKKLTNSLVVLLLLSSFFIPITNVFADNNKSDKDNINTINSNNINNTQSKIDNKKINNNNEKTNNNNENYKTNIKSNKSKLTVKYTDKITGKELIPQVTLQGEHRQFYNLKDTYKKEKILDGKYILDESSLPKNETGNYSLFKKNQTVEYKYIKNPTFVGSITLYYIDEENPINKIQKEFTEEYLQGVEYDITKELQLHAPYDKSYVLSKVEGDVKGKLKAGEHRDIKAYYKFKSKDVIQKEIKYVYKHDPQKEIFEPTFIQGVSGEQYNTQLYKKPKEKYDITLSSKSAPEKGIFSKKNNQPTIYEYAYNGNYNPNDPSSNVGQVQILKEDIDNNINIIEDPKIIIGEDNAPYNTNYYSDIEDEQLKDKYDLIGIKPGYNAEGKFQSRKENIVVYQYRVKERPDINKGKIILNYLDENSNDINNLKKEFQGIVGQKYDTSNINHPQKQGYRLDLKQGNIKGYYTKKNQEIVYQFVKIKKQGRVLVKYQPAKGTPENQQLFKNYTIIGEIGDNFTINPISVSGYTVKLSSGVITGTFKDEDQTTIFEYSKINT